MIKFPNREDLKKLASYNNKHALTIYVPMLNEGEKSSPSEIDIKNVLRRSRDKLLASGFDIKQIKKMLDPVHELMQENEFWPNHHEGIVMFIRPNFFKYYYIPYKGSVSKIYLQKGFNLFPLLEIMENNKEYYLLTVGHKYIRLFLGDHYRMTRIRIRNLPTSMKEALGIDENINSRETHAIGHTSLGRRSRGYHQQYIPRETDKTMLKEFFRRIDHSLHELLSNDNKPLIIAGVGYVLPIYRKVNTYPGLVEEEITGSQKIPNLKYLRDKSWQIVKKLKY